MNTGTFIEVDLVFDMWEGNSYMIDSPVLNEASSGSFHSGSTFNANLFLRQDEIDDLKEQLQKGLRPRFVIYPLENKEQ